LIELTKPDSIKAINKGTRREVQRALPELVRQLAKLTGGFEWPSRLSDSSGCSDVDMEIVVGYQEAQPGKEILDIRDH